VRPDLLELLCCPVCRAELRLEARTREKEEIVEGTLVCTGCSLRYPIEDGIPNLLPPEGRAT
jgi:uncharacterized protein